MGSEHINQKRYDAFKKLNCELIGMSVAQMFSYIKWEEWIKEKLNIENQLTML
jgi:peroxiredoxin (alkyl hydroperoxide reductase subunit C)